MTEIVCERFVVDRSVLCATSTVNPKVILARRVWMWLLASSLPDQTAPKVGAYVGLAKSSVRQNLRMLNEQREKDEDLDDFVDDIEEEVSYRLLEMRRLLIHGGQ